MSRKVPQISCMQRVLQRQGLHGTRNISAAHRTRTLSELTPWAWLDTFSQPGALLGSSPHPSCKSTSDVAHRRTGSAPGIEMRTSPQVSDDNSAGPASREGSRHGAAEPRPAGRSPLGGSPRSDADDPAVPLNAQQAVWGTSP